MDDDRVKEIREKLATAAPGQYGYRSVRADIEFLLAKLDQAGKLDAAIMELLAMEAYAIVGKRSYPKGYEVGDAFTKARAALHAFRTQTPPENKP